MAYIPAVANPLSRLPVRRYRGPMKNILPGLGALNCPADPGCPGNPAPVDIFNLPLTGPYTNPSPQTEMSLALSASALNPNLPASTTAQGFTNWINQNSSTVMWIAGIGLGVLFLARVAR